MKSETKSEIAKAGWHILAIGVCFKLLPYVANMVIEMVKGL